MADTRMAEMSTVMEKRDRQADERMKLMSDSMQRRETDANIRMVDQMTTVKDLTLGVRAMASQTAAAQAQATSSASGAYSTPPEQYAFTSAAPLPTQATYRKVAQPSVDQIKPSKLIPPATNKRPVKDQ